MKTKRIEFDCLKLKSQTSDFNDSNIANKLLRSHIELEHDFLNLMNELRQLELHSINRERYAQLYIKLELLYHKIRTSNDPEELSGYVNSPKNSRFCSDTQPATPTSFDLSIRCYMQRQFIGCFQ